MRIEIKPHLINCFLLLAILIGSKTFGQETLNFKQPLPDIITPSAQPNYTFRGDNYQGFISTCSDKDISEGLCWNPSRDDVSRLEKGLPKYVLSNIEISGLSTSLPKYDRIYYGNYKNFKKIIKVWLAYPGNWGNEQPPPTLETKMPTFSMNFDVQTGKFSDFREENYFGDSTLDDSPPMEVFKVNRIVIDPGKGGKDFGAMSFDKKGLEKDINLKIAKKVVELLKRESDLLVLITRQGDEFLSDKERSDFGNSHKANLFISIHCNQDSSDEENGTVSFIYASKTHGHFDAKITEKNEGEFSKFLEKDLQRQTNKMQSLSLAESICKQINDQLNQPINRIRIAELNVLENLEMPSVWIGMAYLTNKEEADKLENPKWQDQMAEAIVDGILNFKKEMDESIVKPPGGSNKTEIHFSPTK